MSGFFYGLTITGEELKQGADLLVSKSNGKDGAKFFTSVARRVKNKEIVTLSDV